jgi:hypothetical protein
MTTSSTTPSVGRIIHIFGRHAVAPKYQPEAAIISYVHTDGTINIGGWDSFGMPFAANHVAIGKNPDGIYADWPKDALPAQKTVNDPSGSAQPGTPAPSDKSATWNASTVVASSLPPPSTATVAPTGSPRRRSRHTGTP